MKVVILGSVGRHLKKIKRIEEEERLKGNTVLSWLHHLKEGKIKNGKLYSNNPHQHQEETLSFIREADKVIAILPSGSSTHFELGYAKALGKRIELRGEFDQRECIYYAD